MDSEELLKKVGAGSRSLPSTSFTGGIYENREKPRSE